MPKNPIFPIITPLLKAVNKIPAHNTAESTTPELGRIADALERIASALEKLTAQDTLASAETNQNGQDNWITLPNTNQNHDFSTPPIAVPNPKPPIQPINNTVTATTSKTELPASNPNASKTAHPPKTQNGNSVLLGHLKRQGITVQEPKKINLPEKLVYQVKLEKVAQFLGKNFTVCKTLYEQLKKNMVAPRTPFSYSLIGATAEQNKLIRQYCQFLKDADLLEEFSYQGSPDFNIKLKASGKEQKFLSGAWLEYYVKLEVDRIVLPYAVQIKQSYEALPNLQIIFKDDTKAELDLFFSLGNLIFCVEAKTRPDSEKLKTFRNRIKPLGLENTAILVIVLEESDDESLKLNSDLENMPIIQLDKLEETLKELLKLPK